MLIFLTLTQECNLKCEYCGGGTQFDDIEDLSCLPHPKDLTFDFKKAIEKLNKYDSKNDKEGLIICFYGGEPLMRPKLIKETYSILKNVKHYVLQTNGQLLTQFPIEDYNKMDTILVSVDGEEEVNDYMRGDGAQKKAIQGSMYLREKGFKGDLIARMTVHKESDIYRDVKYLLNLKHDETGEYVYDHAHWQLDALWDTPGLARWFRRFEKWRDENYHPGLKKLAKWFIKSLKGKKKRILGIAPFLGILWTYLTGQKKVKLRCGSGLTSFNITTAGNVTSCPVAPEINEKNPLISEDKFDVNNINKEHIGRYCDGCDVLDECGGRCLHANKKIYEEKDKKNFDLVCTTVKFLLKVVKEDILPEVQELIKKGDYELEDFHYPKYNNTVEVIP